MRNRLYYGDNSEILNTENKKGEQKGLF